MRNFELTTLSLLLFAFLAGPANGQAQTCQQPLADQYKQDADATRSDAWWNALGRELTLSIDGSPHDVSSKAIGDIIFFATHHGQDVNLTDATEPLLRIYFEHEVVGARVMAVAALHAIGDNSAMQKLKYRVEDEPSHLLQHITLAALRDSKSR